MAVLAWGYCSFGAFCVFMARPLPLVVADHLFTESKKGHGRSVHGLFILDCRMQIAELFVYSIAF
jgi:hypothetical protein